MRTAFGAAGALALAVLLGPAANAAVVSTTSNRALTAAPFTISFGGAASYSFTAAATGFGPGAAVSTGGTGQVSSLLGGVTDFESGATISGGGLFSFSAFPTAAAIPFSAADDFIGLSFTLADGRHFGYAEVAGPDLVRYAFESTPGQAILTGATTPATVPEPASAMLLAAGALVVGLSRRSLS